MAKLSKITGYLVDPNEHYRSAEDWFGRAIAGSELYCPVPITMLESDSFEWNDDLDINYIGCSAADCEAYLKHDVPWISVADRLPPIDMGDPATGLVTEMVIARKGSERYTGYFVVYSYEPDTSYVFFGFDNSNFEVGSFDVDEWRPMPC